MLGWLKWDVLSSQKNPEIWAKVKTKELHKFLLLLCYGGGEQPNSLTQTEKVEKQLSKKVFAKWNVRLPIWNHWDWNLIEFGNIKISDQSESDNQ